MTLSSRPSKVKEIIDNHDGLDRAAVINRLHELITEEVFKQQSADYGTRLDLEKYRVKAPGAGA